MRVLMVEDESEVARVVTRRLNRLGFEADCVSTLRDAREALERIAMRSRFWTAAFPMATAPR